MLLLFWQWKSAGVRGRAQQRWGNVMGGQGQGLWVGFCGGTESREGALHLAGESFTYSLIQYILIEHKNSHLYFNVSTFCLASRKKNN